MRYVVTVEATVVVPVQLEVMAKNPGEAVRRAIKFGKPLGKSSEELLAQAGDLEVVSVRDSLGQVTPCVDEEVLSTRFFPV